MLEMLPVANAIKCPNCQSSIDINEVMSAQLSSTIRSEIENEVANKRHEVNELAESLGHSVRVPVR